MGVPSRHGNAGLLPLSHACPSAYAEGVTVSRGETKVQADELRCSARQKSSPAGFRGEEWKAYFILIVRNVCCSLLPNSYGTGIDEVKVLSPSLKPE